MRRVLVMALLAFAAAPVAAADSSDGVFVFFGTGWTNQSASWDLPVEFEGQVSVRFQGGFGSGQTVWTPGSDGQMTVAKLKTRKGTRYTAFIGSTSSHGTTARVDRVGGVCTDVASLTFDQAATTDGAAGIKVGLAPQRPDQGGFHMSDTRCGGPLMEDLGRVLPMVTVTRSQLATGGFDIDLHASVPLAVAGLTATVDSTVVIHVGKRKAASTEGSRPDPAAKAMREISVSYSVARASGTITTQASGGGSVCADLDSCGAHEAIALQLRRAQRGEVTINAFAPRRRPLADLRASVGLQRDGNARGIQVAGFGNWHSGDSTFGVSLDRGAGPVCQDNRHASNFDLQLTPGTKRVAVRLSPLSPLRTICPGPTLGEGFPSVVIASGSFPRSALAHKRITIHLTRGAGIDTAGWSGPSKSDVTIVLLRRSVELTNVRF